MVVESISGNSAGSSDDFGTWTAEYSHTGRRVRGDAGYSLADSWSGAEDPRLHEGYDEFAELIQHARWLEEKASCFRGRWITGGPPARREMGPPEPSQTSLGGRYHPAGTPALYLCDSEVGVRRELEAWEADGVIYVQKFILPVPELRIADFAQLPEDHFVTAVFAESEQRNLNGHESSAYEFSQLIGEIVSRYFDGMRVPGVRGSSHTRYRNVVVFEPHPRWDRWLAPNATPYRIEG